MRDVTVHLPGELTLFECGAELVIGPAASRRSSSSPASGRNAIVSTLYLGGTQPSVSINANVYLGCDVPHWSPRC